MRRAGLVLICVGSAGGCGGGPAPVVSSPITGKVPALYLGQATGAGGRTELTLSARGVRAPARIAARVYRRGQYRCVRLTDAALPSGEPPNSAAQCVPFGALAGQDHLQGYALRLKHGLALDGIADPATISAVRVRRHGWPAGAGVTLAVSRSGGFALIEPGRFAAGATFELRPVYRKAHARVMRLVGIGPVLGGRPATRVRQELADHFRVLRRPATPADHIPGRASPGAPGEFDANPRAARLVARSGRLRGWLIPGARSVCTMTRLTRHGGGATSCGSATEPGLLDGTAPLGQTVVGPGETGHRQVVFVALADGSSDARLVWSDGHVRRLPMGPNGVIARTDGARWLTWRAADGSRQRLAVGGPPYDG